MSLTLGAAALMAGANLASSALGAGISHHDSKADRAESARQFNEQMDYAKNQTQYRVSDALKAGINPLAALGISANVSPTIHSGGGSDTGSIIAAGGREAARIMQDYLSDKMQDESESSKLDLESKRIENRIQNERLKAMTNKPEEEEHPKMMGQKTLFTPVYDIQGRPRLVLDQNVMETDADNPGYTSSMIATMAEAAKRGDIDLTSGRIKNDQLRMLIDDFYYNTTGHHISNLEDLYISPSEAAAIAAYVARGVS